MRLAFLFILFIVFSCSQNKQDSFSISKEKKNISKTLNNWHKAASEADFETYFSAMDSISIFIGTDATENWTKKEFKDFSKPYFDKGKAWSFTAVERNIYLDKNGDFTWFDELLDTWMGACRGSGVLEKTNGQWKIKHYVLSVTIPNDDIQKVLDFKIAKDSIYLKRLPSKLK